jgi:hemoglobin-like flavoprotein
MPREKRLGAGGNMDKERIDLIKASFAQIEPVAEEAGVLFYIKLFKIDPELRRLFRGAMNEQGVKLMQMIGYAVRGLDRIDELIPAVQALGLRHAGYGVKDHHYETVGSALLWTFEAVLGPDFSDDTRDAWAEVYGLLAQTMKDACGQGAAAARVR